MPTCEQIEATIEEFLEHEKTLRAVGGPNESVLIDQYRRRLVAAAIALQMLFQFSPE